MVEKLVQKPVVLGQERPRHVFHSIKEALAADIRQYFLPHLSSRDLLSIGCGEFEEAEAWVEITGGKAYGIDIQERVRRGGDRPSIITQYGESGDATRSASYAFADGKNQFDSVWLRHPEVTRIAQVYADTFAILLGAGGPLIDGGQMIVTTYDFPLLLGKKEHLRILNLLQPYADRGVIRFTIEDEGRPFTERKDREHVGDDRFLVGFEKIRGVDELEKEAIKDETAEIIKSFRIKGTLEDLLKL